MRLSNYTPAYQLFAFTSYNERTNSIGCVVTKDVLIGNTEKADV